MEVEEPEGFGMSELGKPRVTQPYHERVGVGAPLVAQKVKNLPAMQETWVQSLVREDPLEESMAAHSSSLVWSTLFFSIAISSPKASVHSIHSIIL